MSKTAELDVSLKGAIEKVGGAGITLKDLLGEIAPAPEKVPAPSSTPLPVKITESESEALEKVVKVYGQVVPQERRILEPTEVSTLLDERDVLKTLEKMAKRRTDDIRTTVFNHLDVLVEAEGIEAEYDDNGHFIVAGEVAVEDQPTKFVRQISERSPSLNPQKLKELADDPEVDFSHEDYLAVTTQTRVLDENKLMLHLKKRPELLAAIRDATTPGKKGAALYQRKR